MSEPGRDDRRARRAAESDRFLAEIGWSDADRRPLAGDASNRRYDRLRHPQRGPAVLMDADPALGEDVAPFAALTRTLRSRGLSAPEIVAVDPATGFMLLEDLGDALFSREAAARPADEATLYAAAIDVLAHLHRDGPIPVADAEDAAYPVPPYDLAELRREADLAIEWWRPAATGAPTSDDLARSYRDTIDAVCGPLAEARAVLVLRDYHAENLLWLPERSGVARVGLLDYQDALIGHPAYDLASLLEDARRDVSPALAAEMIDRYVGAAAVRDRASFEAAYAALAAQRNLKIIGIFARLWRRDGKDRYLAHIPRVWRHLRRDLEHPALAPLRLWVERRLPEPTDAALARARAAEPIASPEDPV